MALNDGTMPKEAFEKKYGKGSSVTSASDVKSAEKKEVLEETKPEVAPEETKPGLLGKALKKFTVLDSEGKEYGHFVEAVSMEEAAKQISPDETLMEVSGETLNADGSVTAS